MKNKLPIIVAILIFALSAFCLFACEPKDEAGAVDYKKENSFSVRMTESNSALTFEPVANIVHGQDGISYTSVKYRYGVLFYVGTNADASAYSYIGNALAKQGYLVVIDKDKTAYKNYSSTESVFSQYGNIDFFVSGHSAEGGAAAIRRAGESSCLGAILLAPIADRHAQLDENGNRVQDKNGVDIYVADTLANTSVPTLLIEGNSDLVRTSDQTKDVKERMPQNCVEKIIANGTHTGFFDIDDSENLPIKFSNFIADFNASGLEQKQSQRDATIKYFLDFMAPLTK